MFILFEVHCYSVKLYNAVCNSTVLSGVCIYIYTDVYVYFIYKYVYTYIKINCYWFPMACFVAMSEYRMLNKHFL